jgi:hypothetical protein
MKKIRRVRDFYTLDPELYNKFLKHIENKNLDKSKLIETLIKEYMEKLSK